MREIAFVHSERTPAAGAWCLQHPHWPEVYQLVHTLLHTNGSRVFAGFSAFFSRQRVMLDSLLSGLN